MRGEMDVAEGDRVLTQWGTAVVLKRAGMRVRVEYEEGGTSWIEVKDVLDSKDGPAEDGPVEVGPAADGPVEDGPVEVGPAEDGPVVRLIQVWWTTC